MDKKIAEQIEQLRTNIGEMLESSGATKGPQFMDVAATIFEVQQILRLISALPTSESADQLKSYMEACARILASITSRISRGMSVEDKKEAVNLGEQLFKRQIDTEAAIFAA